MPSRDRFTRRVTLALLSVCVALGVFASSALANHVDSLKVNGCSSVTFTYAAFPNKPNNTVSEKLTINGTVVATATATFNNASGSSTVPFSGGTNGATLVAFATWNTNGASGSFTSSPQTLSGCAPAVGPPTVLITTPPNGATYYQGEIVDSSYSCAEAAGGPGLLAGSAGCAGPVPNGSPIDTSTTGSKCFKVVATSQDGQSTPAQNCYTVVALTYTGRAYDAGATLTVLGLVHQTIGPVNDTGGISTTSATTGGQTIAPITGTPLTAHVLTTAFATGGGTSAFAASVADETVAGLGLPTIASTQVASSSTTKCNAGTLSSSGATNIASLTIGSTVVVGPGGLVPAGPIPPNTTLLNVPGVGKVVLNEQLPIADGLAVNAIHVTSSVLGLGTVDVIVVHAESDLHGCAAVTA